jgi:uncharacterized peroxidase-related enzyme
MSRIAIPARDESHPDAQPTLDAVYKIFGFVPNLHRLMSLNPPALNGWAQLQALLAKTLDVKTRDAIAMAVSEVDGCNYCLAAHSYIAGNFAKMSPEEIALNRQGKSLDSRRGAAAHFAKRLIEARGKVSDEELAAVRAAGFSEADVIAIVALSVQFLFTNFMNNVADTDIDFPAVKSAREAA